MDITKLSETCTLEFAVTGGPSTQMYNGGTAINSYTFDPDHITISIENDKFVSLAVANGRDFGRSYKADSKLMPNWLRQFVREVLPDGIEWPMRDEVATEYVIVSPMTSVAIVDVDEVVSFLKKDRTTFTAVDFTVTYDGGEPVNGAAWLRKNKLVSK